MIEKTYNLMAGEVYVFIETKNKEFENEIQEFTHKTLIELISIFKVAKTFPISIKNKESVKINLLFIKNTCLI